jgi:hypothetical protein
VRYRGTAEKDFDGLRDLTAQAPSTTLPVAPLPHNGSPLRERGGVPLVGEEKKVASLLATTSIFRISPCPRL